MIQSFIYATESNNLYLYDDERMLSLLVHPELKKAHEELMNVDSYYLKKYEYFRKYGFFAEPKVANFGTVNESMVEEGIISSPQIIFEVTDSCNLNCTYCGYGELYEVFNARNAKNINTRNAITFLEYILNIKHKHKKNRLSIGFYGGEPLINIRFIKKIVEVVNQLNSGKELEIQYSMTTNATLIHKHIDFLVENKFTVTVSLDGNEENHSYRVFHDNKKNSFGKVIENMDMIQRDYYRYFVNHINFIAVLHNRNSSKSVYEFIYTRYHKIPLITELATNNVNPKKKEIFEQMFHSKRKSENEYQNEESNIIPEVQFNSLLYKELEDFLKCYSINYYLSNLISLIIIEDKYFPTSTCLPLSRKFFFTNRNQLLPCEKINQKYSMGKVDKNILINIQELTRKHIIYYDNLKKVCQSCYAYKFCGLCMYNIKNLDKLGTEEFVCEKFYDQNAFKNKLSRIFSYIEKYPSNFFRILENSKHK
jgi:uncharacterized protein